MMNDEWRLRAATATVTATTTATDSDSDSDSDSNRDSVCEPRQRYPPSLCLFRLHPAPLLPRTPRSAAPRTESRGTFPLFYRLSRCIPPLSIASLLPPLSLHYRSFLLLISHYVKGDCSFLFLLLPSCTDSETTCVSEVG